MVANLPFLIWVAYIVTVCVAAFWVGRLTERLGALVILCVWLATLVAAPMGPSGYSLGVATVDIVALLALVALAMRSERYWPLWAAGFHLLAVATHWAHKLDPSVESWTYVTAGIIWGYLVVAALAFGTWGAWRERQLAKAGDPAGATLR